jgi:hypothetical protein
VEVGPSHIPVAAAPDTAAVAAAGTVELVGRPLPALRVGVAPGTSALGASRAAPPWVLQEGHNPAAASERLAALPAVIAESQKPPCRYRAFGLLVAAEEAPPAWRVEVVAPALWEASAVQSGTGAYTRHDPLLPAPAGAPTEAVHLSEDLAPPAWRAIYSSAPVASLRPIPLRVHPAAATTAGAGSHLRAVADFAAARQHFGTTV